MKVKIIESKGLFYPVVKLKWYSSWKYISYYQFHFKLYNSREDYCKDWNTNLIDDFSEAKKILSNYIDYYDRQRH